jgi:XTP/dITP diphosphohydrolase
MKEIVFATANPNKVREVKEVLGETYLIKSLPDIGCHEDIAETSDTFEGNALLKARYVFNNYQLNCFSEDTGLEVDALNGEPGVITARYAGPERDNHANMNLVLQKLDGKTDRGAQFRTVVALILDGKEYTFEGICRGRIAHQKTGTGGFGYDPIFIPEGYDTSFAEMEASAKNAISHRGQAVQKLITFLQELNMDDKQPF